MLTNAQKQALEPQQTAYMKHIANIDASILALLDGRQNDYAVSFDPVFVSYRQAKANCEFCRADLTITQEMVDEVVSKAVLVAEKYK